MALHEVTLPHLSIDRFVPLVGEPAVDAVRTEARAVARARRIWNVNSTEMGGGVAEMLRPIVAYARDAGIDARWVVIDGTPDFFRITKRLHNALHGEKGDGSPLGPQEHAIYEAFLNENAMELGGLLRRGDIVVLHDPQTAGMAPLLARGDVEIIWRCHIGRDEVNEQVQLGWRFLTPYLRRADVVIFSRGSYIPAALDDARSQVVMPAIDPFSPKNEVLDDATVHAILRHVGLLSGRAATTEPRYTRADGTVAMVEHAVDVQSLGPPPPDDCPLVVQVSRWDTLKDPIGVMLGFAKLIEDGRAGEAHLMLAGPNVHAVADDPDGAAVYASTVERWRALPHEARRRVHLAMLPMHDIDENAVIVNALQRHARVVVQKSLHEGFGLTVTEAMWKQRAVVASDVGGIRDQIIDGVTGLLLRDPRDLDAFGALVARLLSDPVLAAKMGREAHSYVLQHFLALRTIHQYTQVVEAIDRMRVARARTEAHAATSPSP